MMMYRWNFYIEDGTGRKVSTFLPVVAPTAQDAEYMWTEFNGGKYEKNRIKSYNERASSGSYRLSIKCECLGEIDKQELKDSL